jgi:hypothetical protein
VPGQTQRLCHLLRLGVAGVLSFRVLSCATAVLTAAHCDAGDVVNVGPAGEPPGRECEKETEGALEP